MVLKESFNQIDNDVPWPPRIESLEAGLDGLASILLLVFSAILARYEHDSQTCS